MGRWLEDAMGERSPAYRQEFLRVAGGTRRRTRFQDWRIARDGRAEWSAATTVFFQPVFGLYPVSTASRERSLGEPLGDAFPNPLFPAAVLRRDLRARSRRRAGLRPRVSRDAAET